MVCCTLPAPFQSPQVPASQKRAATAGSQRCRGSSALAAPLLFSSHAELMSPIVYSLTLADTVVSSARQAVSKSPVSKAESLNEQWVWPTEGGAWNPIFFISCAALLLSTLRLRADKN